MTTEILITFATIVLTGGIAWGTLVRSVKATDKDVANLKTSSDEQHEYMWKAIRKVENDLAIHEKEANDYRFQTQKEMGQIREVMGSKDGKLDALVSQMNDLKETIGELKDGMREIKQFIERDK